MNKTVDILTNLRSKLYPSGVIPVSLVAAGAMLSACIWVNARLMGLAMCLYVCAQSCPKGGGRCDYEWGGSGRWSWRTDNKTVLK